MAYVKKGYTRKYARGKRADYNTAFKEYRKQLASRVGRGSDIDVTYSADSFESFKRDFDNMFEAQRQDRKEGLRKSNPTTKTVVREMLDLQEFKFSRKQAEAYQKWMSYEGKEISLRQARIALTDAGVDFWEQIQGQREIYKQMGLDAGEINALISNEYFGSEI